SPPLAPSATSSEVAVPFEYAAVVLPSVEVALPPAPAAPLSEKPPDPLIADWLNDNTPLVLPETALVIVVFAPAPPPAPKKPAPAWTERALPPTTPVRLPRVTLPDVPPVALLTRVSGPALLTKPPTAALPPLPSVPLSDEPPLPPKAPSETKRLLAFASEYAD